MKSTPVATLDQWADFGIAEFGQGRYAEAEKWFRAILGHNPYHFDGLQLLGLSLVRQGMLVEGIHSMLLALQLKPNATHVLSNLAEAQREAGQLSGQIQTLQRLSELDTTHIEPQLRLVTAYARSGQSESAIRLAVDLFERFPENAEIAKLLAQLLRSVGRHSHALLAYASAIKLAPHDGALRFDLGDIFLVEGDARASQECFQRAISTVDSSLRRGAMLGLTVAGLDLGQWTDWDAHLQQLSTPLNSDERGLNPFLPLLLPLTPERTVAFTQAGTRQWVHGDLRSNPTLLPTLAPSIERRPLRIAFVSPDFRDHPVGRIIAPVVEAMVARGNFALCVHSAGHEDAVTRRIQTAASHWLDASAHSDEAVARYLHEQDVDLVVDLAGPTAGARPGIYRYRPGRVRVSWLGYPGSAAHPDIPYLLTDRRSVPSSLAALFGENVVRLAVPAMTMDGWVDIDREKERQLLGVKSHEILIGSLARWRKINPIVFWQWIAALERVPNTVLIVRRPPGNSETHLRSLLAERSIGIDQVRFVDATSDYPSYLARLGALDLALDTYPYGSHSMTLDGLRVGTPLLAARGELMQSRIGASLLSDIGLESFVVDDICDYGERLAVLLSDRSKLESARSRIRTIAVSKSMLRPDLFAAHLESAYRQILEHAAHSGQERIIDVDGI
jgi:tetratricopeptide (TPR) repeat protein